VGTLALKLLRLHSLVEEVLCEIEEGAEVMGFLGMGEDCGSGISHMQAQDSLVCGIDVEAGTVKT